jgi:hypothetical protein
MAEIVGVIYPIPKWYMNRFFKGKDVFVKPATVWKQLKPGMKFIFYQSREDTGFVGEAKIKRVVLSEDPMKFYEIYGDRIFLKKEELKEYIKSQERWKSFRSRSDLIFSYFFIMFVVAYVILAIYGKMLLSAIFLVLAVIPIGIIARKRKEERKRIMLAYLFLIPYLISLTTIFPEKVVVNGNLVNVPAHMVGLVLGVFIPFTVSNGMGLLPTRS